MLDMGLQTAVFIFYLFELLREGVILTALRAIGDDSVRAEEGVVSEQYCDHGGEDGRDAAALRICGRSNGEPSR